LAEVGRTEEGWVGGDFVDGGGGGGGVGVIGVFFMKFVYNLRLIQFEWLYIWDGLSFFVVLGLFHHILVVLNMNVHIQSVLHIQIHVVMDLLLLAGVNVCIGHVISGECVQSLVLHLRESIAPLEVQQQHHVQLGITVQGVGP
jgi:hypothetical protein